MPQIEEDQSYYVRALTEILTIDDFTEDVMKQYRAIQDRQKLFDKVEQLQAKFR